jgi:hypothetical protein
MALVTSGVILNQQTWISLGTTAIGGGILVTATGPMLICAAPPTPVVGNAGHAIASPLAGAPPLWIATPSATQFWGLALTDRGAVATVTL